MSNKIQAPVFNGTIKLDGEMPVEFSPQDVAVPNQFPVNSGLEVHSGTTCNYPQSNDYPSARARAQRASYPQSRSKSLAYLPQYAGKIGINS